MSSLDITGGFVVPRAVMDHASSSSSSSRIHSQTTNDTHRFSMMKSSFKREYSKSLGTEGGLKPDQVLVPESYVVLDRNSRNQNGSDEEHQQPDGETKVKISTKNVFAVVSIGSHQHKVSPDDLFFVEKLRGARERRGGTAESVDGREQNEDDCGETGGGERAGDVLSGRGFARREDDYI